MVSRHESSCSSNGDCEPRKVALKACRSLQIESLFPAGDVCSRLSSNVTAVVVRWVHFGKGCPGSMCHVLPSLPRAAETAENRPRMGLLK